MSKRVDQLQLKGSHWPCRHRRKYSFIIMPEIKVYMATRDIIVLMLIIACIILCAKIRM